MPRGRWCRKGHREETVEERDDLEGTSGGNEDRSKRGTVPDMKNKRRAR